MIENEQDNVVAMKADDPEMLDAINQARQSLDSFIQTLLNPKSNQTSFLLKVVFDDRDIQENIWLADLDLAATPPTGVVANEPQIPGLTYMSRVSFSVGNVTDWMYLEDGFLVGGFTTRLLQSRERKSAGWKRFLPWSRNI